MSVRSREEPTSSPAVFSRRGLAYQQKGALRLIAFGLLALSFLLSMLFGGGGTEAWLRWAPNVAGTIAAFVGQAILSYLQYVFSAKSFRSSVYCFALGGSTFLSAAAVWPLAAPSLIFGLVALQVPPWPAVIGVTTLIVVVVGGVDFAPEQILAE